MFLRVKPTKITNFINYSMDNKSNYSLIQINVECKTDNFLHVGKNFIFTDLEKYEKKEHLNSKSLLPMLIVIDEDKNKNKNSPNDKNGFIVFRRTEPSLFARVYVPSDLFNSINDKFKDDIDDISLEFKENDNIKLSGNSQFYSEIEWDLNEESYTSLIELESISFNFIKNEKKLGLENNLNKLLESLLKLFNEVRIIKFLLILVLILLVGKIL